MSRRLLPLLLLLLLAAPARAGDVVITARQLAPFPHGESFTVQYEIASAQSRALAEIIVAEGEAMGHRFVQNSSTVVRFSSNVGFDRAGEPRHYIVRLSLFERSIPIWSGLAVAEGELGEPLTVQSGMMRMLVRRLGRDASHEVETR